MKSKLILFLFGLTLSSFFLTNPTPLQATTTNPQTEVVNTPPKDTAFNLASIITFPYTDPQCYVTVESLDIKIINNKHVVVGGGIRINRDISNKTIFIKDPNNKNTKYGMDIYLEDQIRRPIKPGERRKFKTYFTLNKGIKSLEFGVRESVIYTYRPDLVDASYTNPYMDCYNGPGGFNSSDFGISKELVQQGRCINMQYPFAGEFYVKTAGPDDFILQKPFVVKFQVYEEGENSKKRLIYEENLPPLTGFIPKYSFITYSMPWDYKDQKGNPIDPNKIYIITVAPPETYEFKLVGSDEVKLGDFYDNRKIWDFNYCFSTK